MPLVLEKDIEAYLKKRVEENDGVFLKFPATHIEGFPDRILLMPHEVMCFVELKRPKGGRISEIQKHWHEKLRNLGYQVFVIKDKSEADTLIFKLQCVSCAKAWMEEV